MPGSLGRLARSLSVNAALVRAFRRSPIDFLEVLTASGAKEAPLSMGSERVLLLDEASQVWELLTAHARRTAKGRGLTRAKVLLGEGLLTSEGEAVLNSLLRPLLPRAMRPPGYSLAADPDPSATLAALVEHIRTGRGTVVDASLFDAAVHANLTNWAEEAGGSRAVGEALPLTGELPCYRLYETADGGWIALAALEPRFWRRFCEAVGRKDLESRHLDTGEATRREVAELIRARTREEWARLFEEHDLPAEPVLSAAEARRHPQTEARELLFEENGHARLAFPARLDGERPRAKRRFPKLGEHTESLLAELGLETGLRARLNRGPGVGKRFSVKRLLARCWAGS